MLIATIAETVWEVKFNELRIDKFFSHIPPEPEKPPESVAAMLQTLRTINQAMTSRARQ